MKDETNPNKDSKQVKHDWKIVPTLADYPICGKCGTVKQKKNKPCVGVVKVTLRTKPNKDWSKEIEKSIGKRENIETIEYQQNYHFIKTVEEYDALRKIINNLLSTKTNEAVSKVKGLKRLKVKGWIGYWVLRKEAIQVLRGEL